MSAAPHPQSQPSLLEEIQHLLTQLDHLKAVHRSGDGPTFGQVEALFDQADVVRAAVARVAANPADHIANWPTGARAIQRATHHLVELIAQQVLLDPTSHKEVMR